MSLSESTECNVPCCSSMPAPSTTFNHTIVPVESTLATASHDPVAGVRSSPRKLIVGAEPSRLS